MLSIQDRQERLPELSQELRHRALAIMTALDLDNVEVSVLLCDDPTIQELNRDWRGIDKPTDVLSFPLEEYGPDEDGPDAFAVVHLDDGAALLLEGADVSGVSNVSGVSEDSEDSEGSEDSEEAFAYDIDDDADADELDDLEELELVPEMLGDIVISVDTCIRQAAEYNHTPLDEATRLWVHGFLHLCGYDHETEEEAKEMKQREEELLAMVSDTTITPLVSY